MSIDQKALSSILGSEIVGEINPKPDLINSYSLMIARSKYPKQAWLGLFKVELEKLCGFVLRPGAVKPEVWAEIIEMYPEDPKESAKKFAESKGLFEIY